ncbi:MAG: hypothetical protein HY233_05000 [Acidobacteriales bacterium]|nr:hypothetical protein [Terriglobales bacterium]
MALSDIEVRRQIDRILQSGSLKGSGVHRQLLRYLAEKSLVGEGDGLKEYTVALDALGKPSTYDPRHDSVVRIQVGRLRNKLAEYYQNEGTADPILVSLPKGSFKVHFEQARPDARSQVSARWRRELIALRLGVILAIAWAGFATASLGRLHRELAPVAEAWNPELQEFWAPFLESKRPLILCVGTPLFVRVPNDGFFRSPAANTWEDLQETRLYRAFKKELPGWDSMPWYAFTGVGEASAAFLVGKLLGTRRREILVTRSNLLSWQEISDTDLVFLGPPKFNLQLQGMPVKQEITVETNGIRIVNPGAGEPGFLTDTFEPGPQFNGTTHALISRTPGLSGQGQLLMLAGNGSPDTMAAAQWLTQPWRAKELAGRIRLQSGKLPPYYQIVLKVHFRNGVPVESGYLLHRVLQVR